MKFPSPTMLTRPPLEKARKHDHSVDPSVEDLPPFYTREEMKAFVALMAKGSPKLRFNVGSCSRCTKQIPNGRPFCSQTCWKASNAAEVVADE